VPVVDELAADIFMGAFSEKFLVAAQQAGKLLQGTVKAAPYSTGQTQVVLEGVIRPAIIKASILDTRLVRDA
jgi:hypothetical protein